MHTSKIPCAKLTVQGRRQAALKRRPVSRHTARPRLTATEVLLVATLAVAIVLTAAFALRGEEPANVACAPLRVERNDTLWDLASRHPVPGLSTAESVEYIRRLNGLQSSSLAPGQVVLVPAEQAPLSLASR